MATLTEPVYTPAKAQGRIIEFKGYNSRGDIEDGEMRDMMNLTADEYPAIYQRPARNTWRGDPNLLNKYTDPRTLLVKSHFRADGSEVVQQTPKLAVISEYSPKRLVKQITHSNEPDGQSEVIMCIFTRTTRSTSKQSSFYKFNTSRAIAENIDELIQSYDDFDTLFYDLPEYTDEWIAASRSGYSVIDVNDVNNSCRIRISATMEYINLREGSMIRTFDSYAFYYDGVKYLDGLSADTQMVAINTKICFFPEKKYFKLVCDENEDRIGDIDAELSIDEDGTCHIGPNEDLNFYSSTLTLPDDYNIGDYGFETGDAVDINITSAPRMLVRGKKGNAIYFFMVYEINDNYTLISNVSCYKSDNQATLDAAYDSLETWEGYQNLWPQREPNATRTEKMSDKKTIPRGRVKEVYKSYGYVDYPPDISGMHDIIVLAYTFEVDRANQHTETHTEFVRFLESEVVDYSSEGQYISNGVAPVSGVVQDIKGNAITLGDNSFTDTLGNQFDDVDVPFQSISITRKSPSLDFVMEHNNRLWGVSNKDNTIYASKLGDPTNWQYFQNTALDSYYAEQGSDGEWTGCAPYSSHLLFFKEDCIHKVYGSFPSEYQIQTSICHGVEKGSSKSIVFMNDAVLYKSRVGIMGYAGGSPQLISPQFGNEKYKNVVAGTDGRRYYASMEKKSGDHVLMVYDTEYQEWHKQDDLEVRSFAYINGKVVYAEKDNMNIMEMASDVPEADPIQWMAVLGPFDEYIENKKVYSRLKMRYKMPTGSSFSVYIAVDDDYDDDQWTLVEAVTETNELTQELFFMPSRCDQFAIKIVGSGYCKIKSMVREYRTSTMKKENY